MPPRAAATLPVLLAALLLAGCSAPAPGDRAGPLAADCGVRADVEGAVANLDRSAEGAPRFLVDGGGGRGAAAAPGNATYASAWVRTTEATRWLRAADCTEAGPGDLAEGDLVRAAFTGPVTRSEPPQATAEAVLLRGPAVP